MAKFIPDNPELNSVWVYVKEIEHANLQVLDMLALASIYGGKIPTKFDEYQRIVPAKSVYRVRFTISPVEDVKAEQILHGVVHIQGEAQSFFERAYKIVASVLIRESGF